MPQLSIWKKNKGADYKFFDRHIREMFYVGGVDMLVHKYLGTYNQGETGDATQPQYETESAKNIQDLLFIENRDRKYDKDIYELRGVYNTSDADFDLTQFGLFLQNDTIFITFHINDTIERLGRKLMAGDVLEMPHLKDFFPLDTDLPTALRRFYVISDVNYASEGHAPTWWPHLYRIKAGPIVDSQEYKDILGDGSNANDLKNILSTYNKNLEINNAIIAEAEENALKAGYETTQFYVVPTNENNEVDIEKNQYSEAGVDNPTTPKRNGWLAGYLTGDGLPPNGFGAGFGTAFPNDPKVGAYWLRTDYFPNRLFRYDGARWTKIEDDVRISMTNSNSKNSLKAGFINNSNSVSNKGQLVNSRQSLADFLKTPTISTWDSLNQENYNTVKERIIGTVGTRPGSYSMNQIWIQVEQPIRPQVGDFWYNTQKAKLYVYIRSPDGNQWIQPAT